MPLAQTSWFDVKPDNIMRHYLSYVFWQALKGLEGQRINKVGQTQIVPGMISAIQQLQTSPTPYLTTDPAAFDEMTEQTNLLLEWLSTLCDASNGPCAV